MPSSHDRYDSLWSGTWGDMQRMGPVHRRQREALVSLIGSLKPASVLDVGCGAGDNLAAIANSLPGVILSGVDVSSKALDLAARKLPQVRFQELDAQTGRLPETFDLVMSNQVVEHLVDDVSAMRNMTMMAHKWVIIATMRGRMRRSERAIGHIRNYSDTELIAKAEQAGLEVVDIFGWGFPFYSPIYRTLTEWFSSGATCRYQPGRGLPAKLLYHLYGFNVARRGDVVTMLARPTKTS